MIPDLNFFADWIDQRSSLYLSTDMLCLKRGRSQWNWHISWRLMESIIAANMTSLTSGIYEIYVAQRGQDVTVRNWTSFTLQHDGSGHLSSGGISRTLWPPPPLSMEWLSSHSYHLTSNCVWNLSLTFVRPLSEYCNPFIFYIWHNYRFHSLVRPLWGLFKILYKY